MKTFAAVLGVAGCFLLGACATTQTYKPEEAPEMITTNDFVPFYRIGPQQSGGPDASLPADTRVKLLKKEFGFALVKLEDGRTGYVPAETLAVAPPSPPPPKEPNVAGTRNRPYTGPTVDDIVLPDLNVRPEDIPAPVLLEDIEHGAKPEFRL